LFLDGFYLEYLRIIVRFIEKDLILSGVTGIAAIIGIYILIKRYRDQPIIIFATMFILMICFGRVNTCVGSEFALTGYFERRIVFYVFIAASMLAPVGIFAIVGYLDRSQRTLVVTRKPNMTTVIFISFLVVIGTLSTSISIEYQIDLIKEYPIGDSTIEALQTSIDRDPYSTLLTVSTESNNVAKFSSPGDVIGGWSSQIWPSRSPELPLSPHEYSLNQSVINYYFQVMLLIIRIILLTINQFIL